MNICCLTTHHSIRIRFGDSEHTFDFSKQFGPLFVGKNGKDIAQPGPKNPIWCAVCLWAEQGMKVENGFAIWNYPPLPKIRHLGCRHNEIVP